MGYLKACCDMRRKPGLMRCLLWSSVVSLILQTRIHFDDLSLINVTSETRFASYSTARGYLLWPHNRSVENDELPNGTTHNLTVKDTRTFTLDKDYLNGHWARHVEAVPVANGRLVHVHNVCVKGGDDGLVVPHLGGLFNAMGYLNRNYFPGSSWPLAFREFTFQELLGLFGTTGDREQHNVRPVNATLVPGHTYFMNCWDRGSEDTNPAHWLMKIHKLFELAQVVHETHPVPLPPFDTIAFHQCASYDRVVRRGLWPWGKFVFQAATRDWLDAGLWQGPDHVHIIELNRPNQEWTCFEDLVFETQYGNWFPAPPYISKWQHTLLESLMTPYVYDESLAERCRANQLRIHIFQRTEGWGLRRFVNLEEVMALAQTYTSLPVDVVTINSTTSVQNQATLFRAFDLLITSHGSQIANIIFTDSDRTGLIEVLPVVRDNAFSNTARDAGFLSYIISTGHTPFPDDASPDGPCVKGSENMKQNCWTEPGTDTWNCDYEWRSRLTLCDTLVDTTILKKHIETSMTKLCAV